MYFADMGKKVKKDEKPPPDDVVSKCHVAFLYTTVF